MDTPTPRTPVPTKESTPRECSSDLLSKLNLPSSSPSTSESTTSETTSSVSTSPASKTSLTSTADSFPSDPFLNSSPKTPLSDVGANSMLSESSKPGVAERSGHNDDECETDNAQVIERDVSQSIVQKATASASSTPPSSPSSSPWSTSTRSSLSNISTPSTPFHAHSTQQSGSMTLHPSSPAPSTSNANANPTRLLLPRVLTKPPFKPVSPEVISILDADLESVPLPYIVNTLRRLGPRMMAALARTSATIPAPAESTSNANEKTVKSAMTLPRELVVTVSLESEKDKGKSQFHGPDAGEKDVDVDFDTLPTHLLAVYSRSSKAGNAEGGLQTSSNANNQRRKVTLFPTHGIILAAHCANLPALPPERKETSADGRQKRKRDMKRHFGVDVPESIPESESEFNMDQDELNHQHDGDKQEIVSGSSGADMNNNMTHTEVTLPVVPLCIPSPGTFPILQAYLYTKRTDRLLAALVPAIPSVSRSNENPGLDHVSESSTLAFASSPADLSRQLTTTFAPNVLLAATLRTHELWANVVALGIFDDNLWNVINYSWKVLVGALEVVQMKMRIPAKSVLPQTEEGPGSSARNVRPEQSPASHTLQRLPMSTERRAHSGDDQPEFSSPLSMPSLPLSSSECPHETPKEDQKHDEPG